MSFIEKDGTISTKSALIILGGALFTVIATAIADYNDYFWGDSSFRMFFGDRATVSVRTHRERLIEYGILHGYTITRYFPEGGGGEGLAVLVKDSEDEKQQKQQQDGDK